MRIIYLTESLGWSGGAQQVLWMAQALQKRGHEVVLACQPSSEILERAQSGGLATEQVRIRQDYDVPAALQVTKLLKRRQPEILHAQHSTAHAIGLMAAWLSNPPIFAVTRRVIFPVKRNIFSRLKYRSRRINGYVAISSAVKEELIRGGVAPERIEIIPSVVEIHADTRSQGLTLRQELGIGLATPLITTVANYADFKGQDHLVRAAVIVARRVPRVEFLLVGRGTEQLQPMVDSLGLSKIMHLAGFRRDIPKVLAASDLFVLPSLQEAVGTALLEAMAVGLACVGTRVGGIPDVIMDGESGLLVPPADPDALAEAIVRLVQNPRHARILAEKGRLHVQEHFTLDAAVAKMEAFYTHLLSGTTPRP